MMEEIIDVSLGLEGSHVVVTGAAGQIGTQIVSAFLNAGCFVSALDIDADRMTSSHDRLWWRTVDITIEDDLERAFAQANHKFGIVSVCCAAAGLDLSFLSHHASICDLPLQQWQRTLEVNASGTFLTARTWLRGVRDEADDTTQNVSLIIIGSEAGIFGVPGNADYASSKSAVQYGLTRSLAPEAVRVFSRARVNAIAPGPVDTPQYRKECSEGKGIRYQESEATVASRKPVPINAVAKMCLVLASENLSGSINGQILPVDGGKSGRILWQADGTPGW